MREKHKRDFWAYVRVFREWKGLPYGADLNFEKGATNTIRCFVDLDGRGKLSSNPKHPRLLRSAILGKRKLNLQIQMWVEGYEDVGGRYWLELETKPYFDWLPDWVWVAIEQRVRNDTNS